MNFGRLEIFLQRLALLGGGNCSLFSYPCPQESPASLISSSGEELTILGKVSKIMAGF